MTITTIPFKNGLDAPLPGGRQRIIKAAIRVDDTVYLGWRHSEIISFIARTTGKYTGQEQQGFIDQNYAFYDRCTAGKIAARAGQAPFRHQTLLSEQLWDEQGNPRKDPYAVEGR